MAQADSAANAEVAGRVTEDTDANNFKYQPVGPVVDHVGTAGVIEFLDESVAGGTTTTEPTAAGQVSIPVLLPINATQAIQLPYRGLLLGTPAGILASESFSVAPDSAGPPIEFVNEMETVKLVDASTTGVFGAFRLPSDIDLSVNPTITATLVVSEAAGGNNDIRTSFETRYIADGELVTKTLSETVLKTTPITNTLNLTKLLTNTLDASAMAANDLIELHGERLGDDVLDNFDAAIGIVTSARLDYTRKA